jgi:hydroxyethylthiazole kinase
MEKIQDKAEQNLKKVRKNKPLIHNITNYVVMNYSANTLLAMGASPVMAHAHNEVEEMVKIAGALVINIGTLSDEWIDSMVLAGKKANNINIPVILDPVGSGATSYRTASADKIIKEVKLSVIRGNASEILSLRKVNSSTKGVDSVYKSEDALHSAKMLAKELKTVIAITGAVDLITDGVKTIRVANGHPMMSYVTGTGCSATVTIAAFLAVDKNPLTAAATALGFFGLAGEVAATKASAPGSFLIEILNALYTISPEELKEGIRISVE